MNAQRHNLYYMFSQEKEKIVHNIPLMYMVQSSNTALGALSTCT